MGKKQTGNSTSVQKPPSDPKSLPTVSLDPPKPQRPEDACATHHQHF